MAKLPFLLTSPKVEPIDPDVVENEMKRWKKDILKEDLPREKTF